MKSWWCQRGGLIVVVEALNPEQAVRLAAIALDRPRDGIQVKEATPELLDTYSTIMAQTLAMAKHRPPGGFTPPPVDENQMELF